MEFTIHYDETALRRAIDIFIVRRIKSGLGILGLAALSVTCCALAYLIWDGDRSWIVGSIGAVLILFVGLVVALRQSHRAELSRKLAAIPSRSATVRLSDAGISIATGSASTSMPWADFTELWRLQACWLLFVAPNSFVSIPTRGIPTEALSFITQRLPPRCQVS